MDSLSESIRKVSQLPTFSRRDPALLVARDIMTKKLVTFRPEQTIFEAIRMLVKRQISGAPVVDERGNLVGMLSELDCLQIVASGEYYHEEITEIRRVGDLMTKQLHTINPDTGIYVIADRFLSLRLRRLPVVDGGKLVGQVSRHDVLRGIEKLAVKPNGA